MFGLSLATNVIVTTLVAARIWFMTRESGGNPMTGRFRYTRVLLLIIESAMIYSTALVIEITLYFIGSNAFYIVYDPIAQLTVSAPSHGRRVHPELTLLSGDRADHDHCVVNPRSHLFRPRHTRYDDPRRRGEQESTALRDALRAWPELDSHVDARTYREPHDVGLLVPHTGLFRPRCTEGR